MFAPRRVPPCLIASVAASNTFMNETGPLATPMVLRTRSFAGRRRENAKPVPPPDLWIIAVFVRCMALAMAPSTTVRIARAIAGGLLLAAPIWLGNSFAPNDPWFAKPSAIFDETGLNAGSEPVLATQSFLLDQLLGKLEDERSGVTDLYFVGFAPFSGQDVFRKDATITAKRKAN